MSQVDPDSTGLNPAWRKALIHLIWGTEWKEGTPASEINQLKAILAQSLTDVMIKVYDPVDLFVVREGVGSDAWDPTLNSRR